MSGEHDERAHVEALEACLAKICTAHGETLDGFITVAITTRGVRPIGKFNTSTLGQAVNCLIDEVMEHEPKGCTICDSWASAVLQIFRPWRNAIEHYGLSRKSVCH